MSIRLSIAPDSWGVWFPEHHLQPSPDRCLSEMAEAGFEGVELGPWGYFPTDLEQLRGALHERSLSLVAGTIGANFLDESSVAEACATIDDIAKLMLNFPEAKYVVLLPAMYTDLETGQPVMEATLSDADRDRYLANVQRLADHCASFGLEGVFHPHVDSHVETEEQIEHLLANTNVNLCLDLGHHVYGGGEPVAFYRKHAERIPYMHIKDCDLSIKKKMDLEGWSFAKAVVEGIMTVPGKGAVNLSELHEALVAQGYSGWVTVEQDLFPVASFDIPLQLAKEAYYGLRAAGF